MNKIRYYFLMALGVFSTSVGLFSFFTGAAFKAYFYSIFIGLFLIGITYYNNQQKNKK